ncbi:T9SS type A sorting domain-containing protein, partial [Bacteroidota bacterium]
KHNELEYFYFKNMKNYDSFATLSKTISPGRGLAAKQPYVHYEIYGPDRGMFAVNAFSHGFPTLLHEFFHSIEWVSGCSNGVTHGYRDDLRHNFPDWTGETEYDYFRWHFENTIPNLGGWTRLRHTTRWIPFETDTIAWKVIHDAYEDVPVHDRLVADTLVYDGDVLINKGYADSGRVFLEQALELSPYNIEGLTVLHDYYRNVDPDEQIAGELYDKLKLTRKVEDYSFWYPENDTLGDVIRFWHREDVPFTWDWVDWDVSTYIRGPGEYEFSFYYTYSWKAIDIDSVSLLLDGVPVSLDAHIGFSGHVKTNISYLLSLAEWNPDANYTLRAKIKGSGGVKSYGQIHMRRTSECLARSFAREASICEGDSLLIGSKAYLNEGDYTDTLFSVGGCDSIITTHLTVIPAPAEPHISGPDTVSSGETLIYVSSSDPAVHFEWMVENGSYFSGSSNDSAAIMWNTPGTGSIAVYAKNIDGCKSATAILLVHIGTTGIEDPSISDIAVYPNPGSGRIYIDLADISLKNRCTIEIMNLVGERVYNKVAYRSGFYIDVSNWSSGMYVLRIQDSLGNFIGYSKIIIK